MRYVPFGSELDGVPNVAVDGRGNDATSLELSHWPGNATPPELKADTSTEIVLNCLRSPERDRHLAGLDAVSNNHYDIDGLLSIWALLHPDDAIAHADLAVAIAECGDFERWSGEQATRMTCALNGLESQPGSPLLEGLDPSADHLSRTAHLYRAALPLVSNLLDDTGAYDEYGRDEYARVESARDTFEQGEAIVQEIAGLDLAVVQLPDDLHAIAVNEHTPCTRVVRVLPGQRYEVRYRYESWVELVSRTPPPRIDLQPFADLLQTFEGNDGEWTADPVDAIVPRMRLSGPEGDVSSSSVTPTLFVRLLARFLTDNAENDELLWSPSRARR